MTLAKYTSIGCYPLFYVVEGWQPLCHKCAEENEEENEAAVNWEAPDLYCDECDCRIESAYAEDDKTTANTEEGGEG